MDSHQIAAEIAYRDRFKAAAEDAETMEELPVVAPPQLGPFQRITSIAQVQRRLLEVCPELTPVPLEATAKEQADIGARLWEATKATRGAA